VTPGTQLLTGAFFLVGWFAGLVEYEWIGRTVDAWYLFLPAALLGAFLSVPVSMRFARVHAPNAPRKDLLAFLFMIAVGTAGFVVGLTSLANRVGAPTETFREAHRVVRTGHMGRGYVPIVTVETDRGTDRFVITETELREIQPGAPIELVLRRGNLGFARLARVEVAR